MTMLNAVERAVVNNPLRAAMQRHVEARWMLKHGGDVRGSYALEIGCGQGIGTELILERFGATRVDAFDLDPKMVARARRRVGDDPRVKLWVGDASRIDAADGTYDAVFDFAIVHHIPQWRDALKEVHRVLRPGGRFFVEEVLRAFILHPISRRLFDHPLDDRFDARELADALVDAGFAIRASTSLPGVLAWVVAHKPLAS